jgi:hypothetical protein
MTFIVECALCQQLGRWPRRWTAPRPLGSSSQITTSSREPPASRSLRRASVTRCQGSASGSETTGNPCGRSGNRAERGRPCFRGTGFGLSSRSTDSNSTSRPLPFESRTARDHSRVSIGLSKRASRFTTLRPGTGSASCTGGRRPGIEPRRLKLGRDGYSASGWSSPWALYPMFQM